MQRRLRFSGAALAMDSSQGNVGRWPCRHSTLFRETMEEELLEIQKSVGIEAYKKGKFAEAKTL